MKKLSLFLAVQALLVVFVPFAFAKTHIEKYPVPCDLLWRAVKDAVRNSGKYGIVGIDNTEMSISYVIGGTLGGKRINSVVLNAAEGNTCAMQTQTAYSGLIHNDAGDFKTRVDASLAKLSATAANTPATTPAAANVAQPPATVANQVPAATMPPAQNPPELKKGQTPAEVENLMGKPSDTFAVNDSLVYIYPTCKAVFEKGALVDVQYKTGTPN
jgi:hypothetical protein